MFCAKCSAEQQIEDIYCPNCGALIEIPEQNQFRGSAPRNPAQRKGTTVSESASLPSPKPGYVWRWAIAWLLMLIIAGLIVMILDVAPVTSWLQ